MALDGSPGSSVIEFCTAAIGLCLQSFSLQGDLITTNAIAETVLHGDFDRQRQAAAQNPYESAEETIV
jgi:hypothetical protein